MYLYTHMHPTISENNYRPTSTPELWRSPILIVEALISDLLHNLLHMGADLNQSSKSLQ